MGFDPFAVLGLPYKLLLDVDELRARYVARSREVHPDHAGAPGMALGHPANAATSDRVRELTAADVNRAHRVLRDPVERALWVVEKEDPTFAQERARSQRIPADLADTWFEIQEVLGEYRADPQSRRLRQAVDQFHAQVKADADAAVGELTPLFQAFDAAVASDDASARAAAIGGMRGVVERLSYLRTLLRDLDRARLGEHV